MRSLISFFGLGQTVMRLTYFNGPRFSGELDWGLICEGALVPVMVMIGSLLFVHETDSPH